MAYLYKRGVIWWIGYVDKDGKSRQESAKTSNKTRAKELAEELEHRHRRISRGVETEQKQVPTVVELAQRYLNGPIRRKRSFKTSEQRIASHIVPAFGARRADRVTAADVNELLNEKLKALAPQTVEHIRVALSAVYSYGVEELGLVKENPAAKAEPIKIPEREPKVLDAQHIPALVDNVPERWRNLFATAVYTGLRKGELLGLRCKCVDLQGRRILVLHSYEGETKSGKARVVPIPLELVPFLVDAMEKAGEGEFLFPALDGGMQGKHANLPRTFRNAMKRAGIVEGYRLVCRRRVCRYRAEKLVAFETWVERCPKCQFLLYPKAVALDLSFKDLRSTYGTYMYEATDDIRFVQRVLGHHDPKLTERVYAKLTARKLLEQADRLKFGASTAGTYTELTSTTDKSTSTTEGTLIMKRIKPLTSARSRGLEPLTSRVTGQARRKRGVIHRLTPVTLSPILSRALREAAPPCVTRRNRKTPPVTYTKLTVGHAPDRVHP